ncbi:MAG: TMEM165/GDT1 family protein [SAR202 cluster bacterium]|nr:TMEM165/GDT1 family protein [SAR202 cluster bacterium]
MEWKLLASTFGLLFVAELGDKTQLAVITLTANSNKPITIFIGAALALAMVTLLGVVLGGVVTRFVPIEWVSKAAAVAFIGIGVLMLFGKF